MPGHWEGDLIIGKNNRSAIGTLVERTTRFVMLLHLPNGARAEDVNAAMAAKIAELPSALPRSITWDQGKEMSRHRRSASTPASRSTSAIRTHPGSAAATRTPTVFSANTSPKAPISPFTTPPTSTRSPTNSTHAHANARLANPNRSPQYSHRCVNDLNPPAHLSSRGGSAGGQRVVRGRRSTPRIVRRSRHLGSPASSRFGKRRMSEPIATVPSSFARDAPKQ